MKVFISVDMEGISGLVRWADVGSSGIDFDLNRSLMTLDANAAVGSDAGTSDLRYRTDLRPVRKTCKGKSLEVRPLSQRRGTRDQRASRHTDPDLALRTPLDRRRARPAEG